MYLIVKCLKSVIIKKGNSHVVSWTPWHIATILSRHMNTTVGKTEIKTIPIPSLF